MPIYASKIFSAILRDNFQERIFLSVIRILFFIFFCISMLLVPALTKRLTKGFRLAKMQLEFPHRPNWEVPLVPEVISILDQPYYYLDKGSQCYVFESKDGEYVLKLFRYDQPTNDTKVTLLFNGCKAAFDYLKEETGLIFVHLNPTPMGLGTVICRDPIGREVEFQLDQCRFAVQKKAKPFRETLLNAKSNREEMQRLIDQFFDLLVARTEKGVLNSDPSLSRNFGFLDTCAIELDFGNYRPCSNVDQGKEIRRYTGKLKKWLLLNAPEWVDYVSAKENSL